MHSSLFNLSTPYRTRDAYYKWVHRKSSKYKNEQAELLSSILELGEEHKWTLGYLGMMTQLAFVQFRLAK